MQGLTSSTRCLAGCLAPSLLPFQNQPCTMADVKLLPIAYAAAVVLTLSLLLDLFLELLTLTAGSRAYGRGRRRGLGLRPIP